MPAKRLFIAVRPREVDARRSFAPFGARRRRVGCRQAASHRRVRRDRNADRESCGRSEPAGVTVVCPRTTANVDSRTLQQTIEALGGGLNLTKDQLIAKLASLNFLQVQSSVADTARAATFLASDRARMMTAR